jgi:ribosome biogenesis GTPase
METGQISEKIKRGKHTTRHSELFYLGEDTYVMDTPGFTSLALPDLEKEQIREYYPEFAAFRGECRFLGCVHMSEPDCRVKRAVAEGEISALRYENYKQFFEEISSRRKY